MARLCSTNEEISAELDCSYVYTHISAKIFQEEKMELHLCRSECIAFCGLFGMIQKQS